MKTIVILAVIGLGTACGYQGTSTMYHGGYKYVTKTKLKSNPFGKSDYYQITYKYNSKGNLIDSTIVTSQSH